MLCTQGGPLEPSCKFVTNFEHFSWKVKPDFSPKYNNYFGSYLIYTILEWKPCADWDKIINKRRILWET